MQFAEIVKEARLQARLSQRGLAEQLTTAQKPDGVWATYVGQIEKGDKVPSDEVCIKLAEVLQLDLLGQGEFARGSRSVGQDGALADRSGGQSAAGERGAVGTVRA